MRWPFVSREYAEWLRETLDRERRAAATYADQADARYDALLDKYQSLTEKYVSLKMAGAAEVPKPDPVQASIVQHLAKHDEMLALIDQRAGNNTRIRGMMLRQLAADRAANVSDDDIRAAIMNGYSPEGVPA